MTMTSHYKTFFAAAFLLLALVVLSQKTQAQGAGDRKTPVIVSPVTLQKFSDKVEALGTLKANESTDITSTVTERVTAIHFTDGQRVEEGFVLIEMDAAEEQAELREQQSVLEEALRQVERLEPVVKKGAASEADLDERRREALAAEARIQAIQSRIDQRIIKAPYNGIVGLRNISLGALAQPGTKITTLDDDSIMKLDFSVPEVFLQTLKEGVAISATSRAFPGEVFKGTISSIESRIDPITRAIDARALIDNSDRRLKPGLLMQIELAKAPREALVIPEEALIPEGSKNFVLVIEENTEENTDGITARRQLVELGARQFGIVEIINGLHVGDRVVSHGTLRVRPGAGLEIKGVETHDARLEKLLGQDTTSENAAGAP